MTVEITGYTFKTNECHIFANNVNEIHLQQLERNRYDDASEQELEFIFTRNEYNYLYKWLKQQKVVKDTEPKTLGDAVRATLGSITTISGRYLELT